MKILLHQEDIPKSIKIGKSVAIDTETMGLNPLRDRLCLIQLSTGNNVCHLIQFKKNKKFKCPNLNKILTNLNKNIIAKDLFLNLADKGFRF